MPLDYKAVKKQYDALYGAGVTRKPLQEWSAEMNEITNSDLYDRGKNAGWWTQASNWADENIFKPYSETILPTAPIGRGIGMLFGNEEAGQRVGESLPRTLLETAPLFLGPAGIPITAGLMGAHTYADTGSSKAAAISGITAGALPIVGKFGGILGARAFGTAERVAAGEIATETATGSVTKSFFGGWFPKEGAEKAFKAATFAGSQTAQAVLQEASMFATSKALNEPFDPLSADFLIGQIPFTVFDAFQISRAKVPTAKTMESMRAPEKAPAKEYVPPPSPIEEQAQLEKVFQDLESTVLREDATPQEREATLATALGVAKDPKGAIGLKKTFSRPTDEPINITGWGKKVGSSWKIVVDPERTDPSVAAPEHGNVWVNEENATVNPDGSVTFNTPFKKVSKNVQSPLRVEEVRRDPNQPDLPVQKNGLDPDEQRIFEKVGIKVEPIVEQEVAPELKVGDQITNEKGDKGTIVQLYEGTSGKKMAQIEPLEGQWIRNKWPEYVERIKPIAAELEQTQARAETAREKIAMVPKSAEEVAVLVQTTPEKELKGILDTIGVYHSPLLKDFRQETQSVTSDQIAVEGGIRFVVDKQGLENLKTKLQQAGFYVEDRGSTGLKEFGDNKAQALYVDKPGSTVESTRHIVERHISSGLSPTQAVESARLSTHTPTVDVALEETNVLKRSAEKVQSEWKGKPQAIYGEPVRDISGENFPTKELADAFREADPDLQDFVVRNAGKDKGFYLAKQINKEVSLEGTNLEAVLDERSALEIPIDARPDVSVDDALGTIERMGKRVDVADEVLGNNDLGQTLKELKFTREFIQRVRAGEKVKLDPEMQKVVRKVTLATGEWNRQFRNWSIDSAVPHDPVVVQKMGLETGGIRAGLDWFTNHPQSGPMGEFVKGMLQAGDTHGIALADVDFIHDPRMGWSYNPEGRNGKPEITYGKLPSSENNAFDWSLNAAHEVAHHFGAGILTRTDPQAVQFRATLNRVNLALDQSALIPAKVRKAAQRTRTEKWYAEFQERNVAPEELETRFLKIAGEENKKWFNTFYAMQNEHELFAVMFNDHDLVDVLRKTKMPKSVGETVLQFFSKAWNRLFNGAKPETDNALHEILTRFEGYLSGPKIVQGKFNGRDYLRDALIAKGVRPEGLASRVETLERLFVMGDLKVSLEGFVREAENGLLPATAELPNKPFESAFFDQKPTDLYQSIKGLLAEDVPAYQELWARMRQDAETARELLLNIEKGYVPGSIPPGAKEKLGETLVMTNAMKRGLDKQRLAIERWSDLQNFTPEGVEDTIASQLTNKRLPAPPDPTPNADVARGLLGLEDEISELTAIRRETAHAELHGKEVSPGLIARNLMLTQHVKKLFPAFRSIANKVRETFAVQHEDNRALTLAYSFGVETGKPDKTVARSNARIASNESLKKAASNIRRWANIIEAKGETWSFDHPEVQQILSKFNKADQEALKLENNSGRARHHVYTEVIVPKHLTHLNKSNTAKIIAAHETGMIPDQAREVADGIYEALGLLQAPETAVTGNEMLRELSTKVQSQTFLTALRYSQEMIQVANDYLVKMRSRPSYSSEQRYDKHHLVMQGPEGQDFRVSKDSETELRKIEKEKLAQGYKFLDFIRKSDANVPSSVRQDVLDSMRELDVQRYNRLEAALANVDPVIRAQLLPETLRTQQYEASANAFKPLPTVHRRFVEGREYIDMLQNENEFYSRATNYWRHRITEAETSLDMMHHDIAGNRALKEFSAQHVENSLTPDNPFFRKLVKAVYFQRLAFSFGNSLLESTQHLGTGMQSLISETGSITNAFSLWGQAIKAVTQRGDKLLSTGIKSDEMQWLRKRAEEAGIIRVSQFRDVHDPDSEAVGFAHRLTKNPLAKVGNALEVGATKWATFFQRFNDEVGLYAGYKLGREKGMSQEEAFNFAWDIKERGTFTGGKSQRPVGMWSIKTKPVPQMLSALQTYTLGWFSQMSSDWKIGFRDMPGDFSPTQRQGSRKAFVYGLAAQATLAGALGLPGVGQGLSLLKQATGLDLKGELRATLASLFDEDQENGGMLTNLALRGGLAGISPIDPSNRAAISFPFVGVDPYKGFDLSALFGATGTTVSDAVKGTMSAAKGDWVGFQKLLPSVLRPPLQLLHGDLDVRDARGGLIQKLSPAERWFTAFGLPPSRVQSARDTAEAVKNLNEQAQRDREHLVDDLATTYRKQSPTLGQQKLVAYLQDHPQEDGAALVRAIAKRVKRQVLPYDYRRDLNVAVDLKGLGSRMKGQELEGQKLEYEVQRNLGLRPKINMKRDLRAITVDQLMDSDPYLSRAAAIRQVEEMRPTRRRSNASLFQAPQLQFQ